MISVILQTHGFHGFHALVSMMRHYAKQEIKDQYMAVCLSTVAQGVVAFGGGTWNLPSYYELMHPDEKPKDERSGEEIRQYILSRLQEGGE